jgi:hypothetical protein
VREVDRSTLARVCNGRNPRCLVFVGGAGEAIGLSINAGFFADSMQARNFVHKPDVDSEVLGLRLQEIRDLTPGHSMKLLHRCGITLMEYTEIFALALAFVRKSLYRTRRFHSLWASAAHTTHAINANSRRENCGHRQTDGGICGARVAAQMLSRKNWTPDVQGKLAQTLST